MSVSGWSRLIRSLLARGASHTQAEAFQAELSEQQRRYQSFFAKSDNGIWQLALREPVPVDLPIDQVLESLYRLGRLASCNAAYARMKGASSPSQLVGATLHDLMPHNDRLRFEQMRLIVSAGLQNTSVELQDALPDGSSTYRVVTATPIIEDGKMVELWGISCDITPLKQAELALRESERRYRTLFDSSPDALFLIRDGRIVECNPKSVILFGRPLEEMLDRVPSELSPERQPDGRDSVSSSCSYLADAVAGSPQFFEWQHCKGNGAPFDAEVSLNAVHLDNGIHIVARVRDITASKQRERELSALKAHLEAENTNLREVIHREQTAHELVGESASIRRVRDDIGKVGPTNATVLILGETGTGKELVAHAVHEASLLSEKPLVIVNCAALSPTLIESEFFGHEKGAFTGAAARKRGRFELADGGTIFLDEVGDLPLELQAKLLRTLQSGEFERVGGTETLKVNVRVIAATNRNLEEAVQAGHFRADLYYRLNVFPIPVPPLRDRRSDIPALIQLCLRNLSHSLGKPLTAVAPASLDRLMAHEWPGNVRELFHVLERAAIRTAGTVVDVENIIGTPAPAPALPVAAPQRLEDVERIHILETLRETNWVIEGPRGAAARVGLHPNTLRYRMKKLGIERPPRS
jgi:formate hydrogenlyase transcriptional activator